MNNTRIILEMWFSTSPRGILDPEKFIGRKVFHKGVEIGKVSGTNVYGSCLQLLVDTDEGFIVEGGLL